MSEIQELSIASSLLEPVVVDIATQVEIIVKAQMALLLPEVETIIASEIAKLIPQIETTLEAKFNKYIGSSVSGSGPTGASGPN